MRNPQFTRIGYRLKQVSQLVQIKEYGVIEEYKNKINFPIRDVTDYIVIKNADEDIKLVGNIFENVYSKASEEVKKYRQCDNNMSI